MVISLALGCAAVAITGGVFLARGRKAAGTTLVAAALPGLLLAVLLAGRPGVHQFMLGTLIGLPVLVGSAWTSERRERARRLGLGGARRR
ncbi:hypothetical protein QUV83_09995 [Cellulomonas cellasea]|uniref:hypothetical protein n=1 Tax=Cellulomonas cellasea TaxID=43670 RepID=UPI0025A37FC3|nr:hypothetical protein [Cellulomonas cellasea]MDM8085095.1 hypothetical protein [Cellulomonas cellasea]